jgi:glycosyltransferase involved in cell wall biosynthesis
MDREQLTLSAVVISWNQRDFLVRLIGQLLDQSLERSRYEIIIVDDGSTDGSREWLQSLHDDNVRVILRDVNRGRGASRNAGILAADGDIIVMIDGDHTVARDYLSVHMERHRRERCVIVGKSDFVDKPEFVAINHYLNHGGATKLPPDSRLPGRYFLTRNCSAPKGLLVQVGLFDERFLAWGGEDLDLGLRLEESGVPIHGEPRALAIHHHLRPLAAVLDNMFVYGRDGIPVLLSRHPRLFTELNLDQSLRSPFGNSRFGMMHRCLVRFTMLAFVYGAVRMTAYLLRRHRLPRVWFDYLHLRQYTRGYRTHLKNLKRT